MLRILFLGDIVGKLGRRAVTDALPGLKSTYAPDATIANVENLTHGVGISPSTMEEMNRAGVDAFTSGNHVWGNPKGLGVLDDPAWSHRLVRPANMRRGEPGNGSAIFTTSGGVKLLLVNLSGQLEMPTEESIENPFQTLDAILESHRPDQPQAIFVDFHAELTAEKEALGHYADGRVGAVMGTHTHVQTSDAKRLPKGTAYCTDVGRVGAADSVIGFEKTSVTERFLTGNKAPYDIPKTGKAEVDGVVITIDLKTGLSTRVDLFRTFVEL